MDEQDNGHASLPPRSTVHSGTEGRTVGRNGKGEQDGRREESERKKGARSPGIAMVAIILAVFMAILDTSIVNVAIPKMMAVFNVGQTEIQWVLTAYTLVVGSLVPVTGYMGDRFGYKKIFMISLVIFTLGSALCGAAWSNGAMIFFRIIQAVGGGALMPVSMAMVYRLYPPEKRGFAMGVFGIAVMFAPAMGPTLSGYITEYLDWRLIFYLNVPVGILDFILASVLLTEYTSEVKQRFDFFGFVTSSLGFSTLLYGLGNVAAKGWTDKEVLTYLIIAAVSLIAFIAIELSIDHPMLDLRLLKNMTFLIALVITSLASVILMGSLFLLPIFLQNISGYSALQTGLILLPQAVTAGIMMPISGYLFDRIGGRPLAVAGLLVTSYSLFLTHYLDVNTARSTLIYWLMLRAVGIGMVMMPIQTAAMNTIPMSKMGQGSALTNTFRQVSASFGIAWLALLLSERRTYHTIASGQTWNQLNPTFMDQVRALQAKFAAMGQNAAQAKQSLFTFLYGRLQIHSMVQAMDDVFYVITFLSLFGALISLFLSGTRVRKKKEGKAKEEPSMEEKALMLSE